ncbi:High mobility group box domain [Lasallia pustulata]|uniref:High mobility group box domain n=1 Tax=Lasallia pustulata TaxID=136370 RepID=A0A1W5CSA0_9LECA|nr:High mobility group box domain [Lasallia pustulata]
MARPKKGEEKAKDQATLQVSIEDFVRTRDSVVTGLATLQSAVQDLSRAYIAHTNTVIGKGPGSSLELLNLTNPLGVDESLFRVAATPAPGAVTDGEGGKKKRKRAPHDTNAPKRALTPYFLYMQTARQLIASQMKPGYKAKEVADEGTRRWAAMPKAEKDEWNHKYAINMARYREKTKAYKEGRAVPEISDEEAKKLYEEQKKAGIVHEPPKEDPAAVEDDAETTSSDSSDDESSEPPKAPSPPKSPRASKRRKTAKEAAEKASSPVKKNPAKDADQIQLENEQAQRSSPPKSLEKKKTRPKKRSTDDAMDAGKEVAEAKSSPLKSTIEDSSKKEKRARKKRKSEAAEA